MKLRTETKTRVLPSIAGNTAVWLCLLLVIMSPINSFAATSGGGYFTFNPDYVSLVAVLGETDTQDVQITNVSGKTITISSITQEFGSVGTQFSETNDCHAPIKAGASCTIKISFTPTGTGGRDHITNTLFEFDVAGTEVAYLDVQGQLV
jgi:hypothetical protein